MPQYVEVGNQVIEFPDGMSQSEIQSVLRRQFSPKEPQGGTIADSLGKGLSFGFADEVAGVLGASANSVLNLFGKGTGESFGEAYRGVRDAARDNEQAFSARNPGTAFTAEMLGGGLTGGVGAARSGAFRALKNASSNTRRAGIAAGIGATEGAISGIGNSEANTASGVAQDAGIGAAFGGTLGGTLSGVGGALRSSAQRAFAPTNDAPSYQRAVQLLKDEADIRTLTTGQATGSAPLKSAEATLSETFLGGSIGQRIGDNRQKFQGRLMEMAGFDAEDVSAGNVSAEAIDRAQQAFSRRYSDLVDGKTVRFDSESFIDRLAETQGRNTQLLPFQQKRQVTEIVDQVFDEVTDGPMTGAKYQRIRSDLAQLAQNNANRPQIAQLYTEIKRALDDEFAEATGTVAKRSEIDKEYNRFVKIRDTFEGSGSVQAASGDLPIAMLLRRSAKRGKGTDRAFTDLVRAGQAVMGDSVANSGTASRLLNLTQLMGTGAASVADPTSGIASVGLPFALNQALSRGITGNSALTAIERIGLLSSPGLTGQY